MSTSARLQVDAHVFEVHRREAAGESTMWDLDWVTGPNPGYGFSVSEPIRFAPDGEPLDESEMTDDYLVERARSFLNSVDPDTGYL